MVYILVGDIGGTNPKLAMVEYFGDNHYEVISIKKLDVNSSDLVFQINYFLEEESKLNRTTSICCIGAAGIIKNNSCLNLTNSKFIVNSKQILGNTYLEKVLVVNDFEGIGHFVKNIDIKEAIISKSLVKIKSGEVNFGNKLVVGPGTGFGSSIIFSNNLIYQ